MNLSTLPPGSPLSSTVTVKVQETPFLVQVPAKRAVLPENVSAVTAVLDHVKVDFSLNKATVGQGRGTAVLRYDEVARKFGVDVTYAGDGKITVGKTIGGHTYGLTLRPRLVGTALSFGDVHELARLADVLGAQIDLSRIPFGLTITGLTAGKDGIVVNLAGRNITLMQNA